MLSSQMLALQAGAVLFGYVNGSKHRRDPRGNGSRERNVMSNGCHETHGMTVAQTVEYCQIRREAFNKKRTERFITQMKRFILNPDFESDQPCPYKDYFARFEECETRHAKQLIYDFIERARITTSASWEDLGEDRFWQDLKAESARLESGSTIRIDRPPDKYCGKAQSATKKVHGPGPRRRGGKRPRKSARRKKNKAGALAIKSLLPIIENFRSPTKAPRGSRKKLMPDPIYTKMKKQLEEWKLGTRTGSKLAKWMLLTPYFLNLRLETWARKKWKTDCFHAKHMMEYTE